MTRHFTVIVTQENRLRFGFLKKEHGLLHDSREKKSYAVIRDAYPTNWVGKWARAYVVHENLAQTVHLEGSPEGNAPGADDAPRMAGATVEVKEPLNMTARIKMPGRRGDDGSVQDVWLSAEAIYDRTMAHQVRRLGNRRIQWFHALLFVSLGAFLALALTAAIVFVKAASNDGSAPESGTDSRLSPSGQVPQGAAPIEQPVVIVDGGHASQSETPVPEPEGG